MTLGYSLIIWLYWFSTAQCADLSAKRRSAAALSLGEGTATLGTTRSLFRREGSVPSSLVHSHDVAPIDAEHSSEQAHVNLGNLMRTHNLKLRGGTVSINSRERERQIGDLHHEFMQAVRLATEIGAEKLVLRQSRPRLLGERVDTREVAAGAELFEMVAFLDSKHGKPDVEFALREARLNDHVRDLSLANSALSAVYHADPSERWTTHNGTVMLDGWNGGLGNRLIGLSAALVFAQYTGAAWLKIKHPINMQEFSHFERLFNFTAPKYIALPAIGDQSLQASCRPAQWFFNQSDPIVYSSNWWRISCRMAPARIVHELMRKYVQPLMTPELSACVDAPLAEHEQDMLTVHIRRLDNPCSLVRQIQTEGKFSSLLVVTEGKSIFKAGKHPCLNHFGTYSAVQNGSLLADTCALMRAKHLLVSWSTFPESLALLSEHLETYYHAGPYEPFHDQSVDYCTDTSGHLWPGTQLVQYNRSGYDDAMSKTKTMEEQKKLIVAFPSEELRQLDNRVCSGFH